MVTYEEYRQNQERKTALIAKSFPAWEDVLDLTNRITGKITRGYSSHRDAPDLAQEVLYKVFRDIGNYCPSYPLPTWIATIAKRTIIDDIRRRSAKSRNSLSERLENVSELQGEKEKERNEISERLPHLITQMQGKKRDVLEHLYLRGFTIKRYASLRKIPIGTAKSRLNRALEKIRETLESERLCD
ncbi:MAG: sigma-70 family RNA polymerase sigma factor [Nanoarchaeota archaeon]